MKNVQPKMLFTKAKKSNNYINYTLCAHIACYSYTLNSYFNNNTATKWATIGINQIKKSWDETVIINPKNPKIIDKVHIKHNQ